MYKIAIVGDRESVLGFSALGIEAFPAETVHEFEETIERLADGDYAVVYVTEQAMQSSVQFLAQYKSRMTPAIIPIPGKAGSLGLGMAEVRRNVEKAVGADILFGG